jgi:hypothetical protein
LRSATAAIRNSRSSCDIGKPLGNLLTECSTSVDLSESIISCASFANAPSEITIGAARKVGEILRFVPEGQLVAPGYAFYM